MLLNSHCNAVLFLNKMQEIVRKQRQMRQEKCKCGHVEVYTYICIYTVYGLYVEVYIIINYMKEHVFVCVKYRRDRLCIRQSPCSCLLPLPAETVAAAVAVVVVVVGFSHLFLG